MNKIEKRKHCTICLCAEIRECIAKYCSCIICNCLVELEVIEEKYDCSIREKILKDYGQKTEMEKLR